MDEQLKEQVDAVKENLERVRREIGRVYIGPTHIVDHMMVALVAGGHVLLEGVPGVAKTTLAKAFAQAIGVEVKRIQFTPDLLPADITGSYVLSPQNGTFHFRRGPVFANLVLADEINRAPPKTQAALLEAMQEHQVTVEGELFELPPPFIVVATQNPIDLEGTYPLPEAQIDRFLVHLKVGYPTRADEIAMLRAHHAAPMTARSVLDAKTVVAMQELARRVHVEEDLYEYAVHLAEQTRVDGRVLLGASPRATLGLLQAAKASSLLHGRAFVTPDDVQKFAIPVMAHRLVLKDEVELDDGVREDVVRAALARVSYRKSVRLA